METMKSLVLDNFSFFEMSLRLDSDIVFLIFSKTCF